MPAKLRLLIDNNKSRIVGKRKTIHKLHTHPKLRLKHPKYFFSVAWRRRQWDGYVKYVTETGSFSTGLLNQVIDVLKEQNIKYVLEDQRTHFKDIRMVKRLGGKDARPYQLEALRMLINNEYEGLKYIRGILNEATNSGKNLIAAGLIKCFSNKRRWLFLIDNSEIYDQAIEELQELLPDESIGYYRGKKIKWERIMVCMVQSLGNGTKIRTVQKWLQGVDGVIVDECDTTMPKKPCKKILTYCHEAPIRVGLSGTPLCSKDKTRNQEILAFFGPIIHTTTNKQLVEWGYSSKPHITIIEGNTEHRYPGDYNMEYQKGIIKNKKRNKKIWRRVAKRIKQERSPVLILIKNHAHIKYLMETCPAEIQDNYTIKSVHHETPNRKAIFAAFKKGKIPILISSMIIRRGKNLPLIRYLCNAAGGDSEANVLQILGRSLRKEAGVKEEVWLDDFWDIGKYLRRHSFHRVQYYKKQGFPVKELYKK